MSKGYKVIDRFSEDLDIYIYPPHDMSVEVNERKIKDSHIQSRKKYFDWLAKEIKIDGIQRIERDTNFDNKIFTSAGIRLFYENQMDAVPGLKDGILLEAGFDTVTPNQPVSISSWALDKALNTPAVKVIDNSATDIPCSLPAYTFVEKLQTLATKFRLETERSEEKPNLMRQYYDIACLLQRDDVQKFIGTEEYNAHKARRFPNKDLENPLSRNEAFLLSDPAKRKRFENSLSGHCELILQRAASLRGFVEHHLEAFTRSLTLAVDISR